MEVGTRQQAQVVVLLPGVGGRRLAVGMRVNYNAGEASGRFGVCKFREWKLCPADGAGERWGCHVPHLGPVRGFQLKVQGRGGDVSHLGHVRGFQLMAQGRGGDGPHLGHVSGFQLKVLERLSVQNLASSRS